MVTVRVDTSEDINSEVTDKKVMWVDLEIIF